jgi:hypothetical protein
VIAKPSRVFRALRLLRIAGGLSELHMPAVGARGSIYFDQSGVEQASIAKKCNIQFQGKPEDN